MVRTRRGAGRIGCLVMLLIVTAIGYFGINIGEAYFNFYRYQDRMKSEARFADHSTDAAMKMRIAAFADSLGIEVQSIWSDDGIAFGAASTTSSFTRTTSCTSSCPAR